jgi:phosphoglycolate phosphatase-like HAD superfamily hydrolase
MRIGIDLDGTIVTCKEKHCALMRTIAKSCGIKFCADEYWKSKQRGFNNIDSLRQQGVDARNAELLNDIWVLNIENHEWNSFDNIIEKMSESILHWINQGHSVHLISARNNVKNAYLQINSLGILDYFKSVDFVTSSSKLDKLNFFEKRRIETYIGDTEADYNYSLAAGIPFYPVQTGMRGREYLCELGLSHCLDISVDKFLECLIK